MGAEGLPAALPLVRSVDNLTLRHNLPAQVSSFIGREAELAAVRGLVGGSRLVTLTGAGGAGKTRLALQVAAGLADGAGDGVWFADLAPLGDPDLVAVTVADVLGVRQEPGRPVLEAVVEAVGGRSLLVLLDNCEHMIGACAKLADALLRNCPNLALLATSREPLGIGGSESTGCRQCIRRPAVMTRGRSGPARRCGCWRTGPPRRECRWPGMRRLRRWPGGSVGGWMASRWLSSWPRRGCGCCRRPSWRPGSMSGFRC
jgi:hypothetical protein